MTKAIYAFSGDPITIGHINIIKRSSKLFEELIVGIGNNPDKKYMFTLQERFEMAKNALENFVNVKVVYFEGLLVDYCYENKISIVIKGLRNDDDFNYEILLHQLGESQNLGIETLLMPADPRYSHISSSTVKSIQKENGLIHEYVTLLTKQKLEKKISNQYIIGITGEIGVGKSFISNKLVEIAKKNNIESYNIELDHISHKILEEYSEPIYVDVRKKIIKEFGTEIISKKNFINRKKLGEIVFNDSKKLKLLNQIMHSAILVRLRKEIYNKKGLIILNAALFAELNMLYLFNNNVVVIRVNKDIQSERLNQRGFNKLQIKRRLISQFDFEKKIEIIKQNIKKDNYGKLFIVENNDINNNLITNNLFEELKIYFDF